MPALFWVTFAVNLIGLVLSLWLGIYLVSPSPRFNIAWLAALTLWSLAGVFLNVLLALNPLPAMLFHPALLRYLFLFWLSETLVENRNLWLQDWSVALRWLFGAALLLLTLYSTVNLSRTAHSAPSTMLRKRFRIMAFATLIAGLIAPISVAGSVALRLPAHHQCSSDSSILQAI